MCVEFYVELFADFFVDFLATFFGGDFLVNVNVYVIGHFPSGLFRTNVNK